MCAHCGKETTRPRYCSETCREAAKWERRKAANPCPVCSGAMAIGSRQCYKCDGRKKRVSRSEHGTSSRYAGGCRCEPCTAAKTNQERVYRQRRLQQGRPVHRSGPSHTCGECGEEFNGRAERKFCSLRCATLAQGGDPDNPGPRDSRPRNWISEEDRRAVFEKAGWCCAICETAMRPDFGYLHDLYPTLDHILPRSRGGSDDPSNLQPAHRICNLRKGARVDESSGRTHLVA